MRILMPKWKMLKNKKQIMDLLNSQNICLRHCLRLLCNEGKVTAAVFEIETVSRARCLESEHISRDVTSQPWVLTRCCCRAAHSDSVQSRACQGFAFTTRTSPLQTGVPTCELCEADLMLNLCFRESAQTTGGHLFRLSATSTVFVHTRPATEEHLELLQDVGTIIRLNVMAGRSYCKVDLP